jgi:hypothetical protein
LIAIDAQNCVAQRNNNRKMGQVKGEKRKQVVNLYTYLRETAPNFDAHNKKLRIPQYPLLVGSKWRQVHS